MAPLRRPAAVLSPLRRGFRRQDARVQLRYSRIASTNSIRSLSTRPPDSHFATIRAALRTSVSSPQLLLRTFFSPPSLSPLNQILPSPSLQRLNARRILPYSHLPIYTIIADVPSYQSFLPYCISSEVTAWSREDKLLGKKWPQEAVLEVGWGAIRERFKSRIFCSPGPSKAAVEAVWGEGQCKLGDEEIAHHIVVSEKQLGNGPIEKGDGEGILTHLWTRWTVKPIVNANSGNGEGQPPETEVSLDIEFRFANPVYAAMSSAVVDGVADTMIGAFEKRVEEKLGTTSG